jgi:non-lysosomal glucosylceramidase
MRSAVPLGGIAAGSIELRADGTLHEWTIENQSPAGGTKIQVFDDALFAIALNDEPPSAIRTHPPRGISGVDAITYSGAYPVGRLEIQDSVLDVAQVSASLFGFSTYRPSDMEASARPAIAFSLVVANQGPKVSAVH